MKGYLGSGEHFYYGTYEKIVAMFATIFMNIRIDVNGKDIKVPIVFAPREKFLSYVNRIGKDGKLMIGATLPIMGFESISTYADEERVKNQNYEINNMNPKTSQLETKMSNRVAYNTDFVLTIVTRNIKEGAKIFEQIVPSFRPSMTVKLKDINEYSIASDIEIVLNGFKTNHEYGSDFSDVRHIMYEFEFTVKHYFYSPIEFSEQIKHAVLKIGDAHISKIMSTISYDVNPEFAGIDDDFDIIETVVEHE